MLGQSPEPEAHDKVLDHQDRIGLWKCWFLRRGKNRSTRRKTCRSKEENQQQTQPTYDAESGNRTRDKLSNYPGWQLLHFFTNSCKPQWLKPLKWLSVKLVCQAGCPWVGSTHYESRFFWYERTFRSTSLGIQNMHETGRQMFGSVVSSFIPIDRVTLGQRSWTFFFTYKLGTNILAGYERSVSRVSVCSVW